MIVNLDVMDVYILAKKTEVPQKAQTNNLKNTKYQIFN